MPKKSFRRQLLWLMGKAKAAVTTNHILHDILIIASAFSVVFVSFVAAVSYIADNIWPSFAELKKSDEIVRWIWLPGAALLALGWLTIALLTRSRYKLKAYQKSHRIASREFANLAKVHYETDLQLFTRLFYELCHDKVDPIGPIEGCLPVIINDIKATVDHALRIFQIYTGEDCTISIIKSRADESTKDLVFEALYRIGFRATERESRDSKRKEKTSDDSAYGVIFEQGMPYFAGDDLGQDSSYQNTTLNWNDDFDFTIVYGIRGPILTPGIFASYQGVLCVDSLYGKLNDEPCIMYAEELSARLAVMLYRLDKVQDVRKELGARCRHH